MDVCHHTIRFASSGRWELVARKAQKRLNGGALLLQMSSRTFGGFLTTAMVGIVIAWIRATYPHYNRSAGRDHFWIVSHDAGKAETSGFPCMSPSWPRLNQPTSNANVIVRSAKNVEE